MTGTNMPCNDCGVLLDSMHDLLRHVNNWCPDNEVLKKKRDYTDDFQDAIKKTK